MSKTERSETAAPAVGFPVDCPVGRPEPKRAGWPWRLLTRADTIQSGDQGLNDDCETWSDVAAFVCGMQYAPGVFLPIRRLMRGCTTPDACRSRRDSCCGRCQRPDAATPE